MSKAEGEPPIKTATLVAVGAVALALYGTLFSSQSKLNSSYTDRDPGVEGARSEPTENRLVLLKTPASEEGDEPDLEHTIETESNVDTHVLLGEFNRHIESAIEGDARAQFEVSYVVEQCINVFQHDSKGSYRAQFEVSRHAQDPQVLEQLMDVYDPCDYIRGYIPSGLTGIEWFSGMLKSAIDKGDPVANLYLLSTSGQGLSEEVAALLDSNPRLIIEHPHAWHVGSRILSEDDPDIFEGEINYASWDLFFCEHNFSCDIDSRREAITSDFYEYQLEELEKQIEVIRTRVEDGEGFDFASAINRIKSVIPPENNRVEFVSEAYEKM